MKTDCFFWGILQHGPVLHEHLQRDFSFEAATLRDYACYWVKDSSLPRLVQQAGAVTQGKLIRGLSQQELERLDFAQACMGCSRRVRRIEVQNGAAEEVAIYLPDVEIASGGLPLWSYEVWAEKFGAEYAVVAANPEGLLRKPSVAARLPQMLVRAASRLRAQKPAPAQVRHDCAAQDVQVSAAREPYARFFSVEEIDVSYRRFGGGMSPMVTRAGFVSCDAVTVLPYDPERDRVLLVEQFRTGPYLRGDAQVWQLEAIAGRIDSGETPEAAARREAEEEAGLVLGDLIPIAQYYPSPGILSEFLYSYLAVTRLADNAAGVFGLETEAEDIRGHLMSFDRMMHLVASGEISNAPLLLTAYWLAQNRDRLRGA